VWNMTEFTEKIIFYIKNIPKGKILTYGKVALLAGNPKGARQVSWTLNSMTEKFDLPWHRVVNSKGKISIPTESGYELQKSLLEEEGIEFNEKDAIDLKRFLWDGEIGGQQWISQDM